MGVIIHNAASTFASGRKQQKSAIRLSASAVEECLRKDGMDQQQVGVFINSGVYRDNHIGEPAIAALIHGDLKTDCGTPLCFDIVNGGVGFINALEAAVAIIENGETDNGIVVSGDAIPRKKDRWVFPYTPAASAVCLRMEKGESGFVDFFHRSFPKHYKSHTGSLRFDKPDFRKTKRHILKITRDTQYAELCFEATKKTIDEYFKLNNLSASSFDLVFFSQSPIDFGQKLKNWLALPEKAYGIHTPGNEVHTASIGYSVSRALAQSRFYQAKNILFVAVGSGIQVSLASYKNIV